MNHKVPSKPKRH